jgi:hypothetical protein
MIIKKIKGRSFTLGNFVNQNRYLLIIRIVMEKITPTLSTVNRTGIHRCT